MAAKVQYLRLKGHKALAVLPIDEYEKLLAKANVARKPATTAAKAGAKAFPSDMAGRIKAGQSPLRAHRKYRELTQADLSERADVGQNVISRIESGNMTGSVGTLMALAKALGITVDDLLV